jgi:hypothetical protein
MRSSPECEGSKRVVYDSAGRVYGAGLCARMSSPFLVPRSVAGSAVSGPDHLSSSGLAEAAAGERRVS